MVSKLVSLLALTAPVTLAYDIYFHLPNPSTQWDLNVKNQEVTWTAVPGSAASEFQPKGNFSLYVGLGQEGGTWLWPLNVTAYVWEERALIPSTTLAGLVPGLYRLVYSLDQDHYSHVFDISS